MCSSCYIGNISVEQLERQVEFWKTSATFKLAYLAIKLCDLMPDKPIREKNSACMSSFYEFRSIGI